MRRRRFAIRATRSLAQAALVVLALACAGDSAPRSSAPRPAGAAQPTAPAAAQAPPAVAAAASAALPAEAPTVAPLSPPVTVKLGLPNVLADVGLLVAQHRGYFAAEGLVVEFVSTPSLNEVIPAVSTGELEVASGGLSAALFNAVARGLPMKIVADRATLGPGSGYTVLVVRSDLLQSGRVGDFADLRGLTIATVGGAGGLTELLAYKAAERGGGRPEEIKIEYLGVFDPPGALANRSLDAAMALEPTVSQIVSQGSGEVFRTGYEIYPDLTVAVLLYADAFLREKPEAARRLMVAYLRGVRDFNDAFFRTPPGGRAEVLAALTEQTPIKDASRWEQMTMPGLNPDGAVNLAGVGELQRWWIERGAVQQAVDVAQLWDGTYVDYALQRLGPYRR